MLVTILMSKWRNHYCNVSVSYDKFNRCDIQTKMNGTILSSLLEIKVLLLCSFERNLVSDQWSPTFFGLWSQSFYWRFQDPYEFQVIPHRIATPMLKNTFRHCVCCFYKFFFNNFPYLFDIQTIENCCHWWCSCTNWWCIKGTLMHTPYIKTRADKIKALIQDN